MAKQRPYSLGIETLMHNLGGIYLKHLGDIDRAKRYFTRALATDPDYHQATVVKGILSQMAAPRPTHKAKSAGSIPVKP